MLGITQRSFMGLVLLVAGTVAFLPAVFPGTSLTIDLLPVVATALLTIGTYLIGTDVEGYPA
jgi:uncharacterized membrane protein